jgi:hypothetical protein
MFWEEPISASNVVKITHQQSLDCAVQLLLSIFELLLSDLSSDL